MNKMAKRKLRSVKKTRGKQKTFREVSQLVETLIKERNKKGLTIKEFAEKMDIPYSTYKKIETGERSLTPYIELKLNLKLKMSLDKIKELNKTMVKIQTKAIEEVKEAS
jgi:transcriptional regulator with XRE-family HTH domain